MYRAIHQDKGCDGRPRSLLASYAALPAFLGRVPRGSVVFLEHFRQEQALVFLQQKWRHISAHL